MVLNTFMIFIINNSIYSTEDNYTVINALSLTNCKIQM